MSGVLIDTDVFVYHLRGAARLQAPAGAAYSTITRCELFAGSGDEQAAVARLLAGLIEHPIDRPVAERAGRLRRDTGIAIADALVAATALEHGLSLMTRNAADFGRVRGLHIRAPR
jgi:predicted nucleic acid-binding protein